MPNFNKGPLSTAEFLNRDTSPTDEINDSYQQSLRNAINPRSEVWIECILINFRFFIILSNFYRNISLIFNKWQKIRSQLTQGPLRPLNLDFSDAGGKILSYNNRPKSAFGGSHASKVIFSASKSKSKVSLMKFLKKKNKFFLI